MSGPVFQLQKTAWMGVCPSLPKLSSGGIYLPSSDWLAGAGGQLARMHCPSPVLPPAPFPGWELHRGKAVSLPGPKTRKENGQLVGVGSVSETFQGS